MIESPQHQPRPYDIPPAGDPHEIRARAILFEEERRQRRKRRLLLAERIGRVIFYAGLVVVLWALDQATESWKEREAGGVQRFRDAGIAISELPGRPVRDISHDGLAPATAYFTAVPGRGIALSVVRDTAVILLGVAMLYPVWISRGVAVRFLSEFLVIILLRQSCDAITWFAEPRGYPEYYGGSGDAVVAPLGYFFSGHTALSLLFAWELMRYFKPPWIICVFLLLTVFFVALVQLIVRAHYFTDVYAGAVTVPAVMLAADNIQRWYLERWRPLDDEKPIQPSAPDNVV